jgi:hypothetical protein
MHDLVRKAALVMAASLMIAGAAMAGVPSSNNSTLPGFINLVGHNNNAPDPAGTVSYTIRDAGNIPVANTPVVLDFTLCTDIVCPAQVSGTTDQDGMLTLNMVGSSNGLGPPRAVRRCIMVTAGGQPMNSINAAAFDRDGVNGIGAADVSLVVFDFVNFPAAGRSDFNDDGGVGAADLALLILIFILGNSPMSRNC